VPQHGNQALRSTERLTTNTKDNGSKIHKDDYSVFGNDNNTEQQKFNQFKKKCKKNTRPGPSSP
jgi:hypothetical protein